MKMWPEWTSNNRDTDDSPVDGMVYPVFRQHRTSSRFVLIWMKLMARDMSLIVTLQIVVGQTLGSIWIIMYLRTNSFDHSCLHAFNVSLCMVRRCTKYYELCFETTPLQNELWSHRTSHSGSRVASGGLVEVPQVPIKHLEGLNMVDVLVVLCVYVMQY
jgi:hypothetical protein